MSYLNDHIRLLTRLYREHGSNSPEFYAQVHRFIIYLQYRFLHQYSEDCQHDCYIRLVEALRYYDPKKISPKTGKPTNLGTFCFTVIRNRISSFSYTTRKHQREGGTIPESAEALNPDMDALEERDEVEDALRRLPRVAVEFLAPVEAGDVLAWPEDHPLRLRMAWERHSAQRPSRAKSVLQILWS